MIKKAIVIGVVVGILTGAATFVELSVAKEFGWTRVMATDARVPVPTDDA